jgi:hypothetical protein
MDKKHRYVYFYDVKIKTETSARGVTNVNQSTLSSALHAVTQSNPKNKHFSYQKDTLHFYIADWHFDAELNQYHILINKSDRNSTNPIFSDPTRVDNHNRIYRREVVKDGAEGLDQSSHIIIQLDQNTPFKGLLLLERGALAGAIHMQTLLTRLISESKVNSPQFFIQNHPNGAIVKGVPQTINTYYSIEVDGHIADSFEDDLTNGSFKELVLISEQPVAQTLDNNFVSVEKTETIKLMNTNAVVTRIQQLVRSKSRDYSKARIRFKNRNGTERFIEVSTQDFDPANYVRREVIESQTASFQSSYITFNALVMRLMQQLITP